MRAFGSYSAGLRSATKEGETLALTTNVLPKTYADSTMPLPIDVIMLDSSSNTAYAYAVVRDRYGNIKRVASNASWDMLQPSDAASVTPTPNKLWEGVVTRIANEGEDSLRAWEASLTPELGDTVPLTVTIEPLTNVVREIAHDAAGSGSQEQAEPGCGCGAGVGLAFIPPVFFKVGAMRRRRNRDSV